MGGGNRMSHFPQHARVLVVDDNDAIRDLLAQALTMEGCFVMTASTGALGYFIATTNPPDLLIVDYDLGSMYGSDLIRLLRAQPALHERPIIGFSGEDVARLKFLDAGATAVLKKPASVDEVMSLVKKYVRCETC